MITSAIPPTFDAYAPITLPRCEEDQECHGEAVLSVLLEHSTGQPWLGYVDTGADGIVFPEAPRVILYTGWPYVLLQAAAGSHVAQ